MSQLSFVFTVSKWRQSLIIMHAASASFKHSLLAVDVDVCGYVTTLTTVCPHLWG